MVGAVGLARTITEDDRLRLRKAGVTALLEIDGKVFAPSGQTVAGTPIHSTMAVNRFMHELRMVRDEFSRNPDLLDQRVAEAGVELPARPEWEAVVHNSDYGFIDARSGVFVPLGRVPFC